MCLNNAKVNVKELFGRKNKSIIMWKVVAKTNDNSFSAIYQHFYYKIDKVNICDRKNKRINKVDDPNYYTWKSIDKGFHFYRDFIDAYKFAGFKYSEEIIVPVICDREDYIAHNKKQAVFMKFRFLCENNNNNGIYREITNNSIYYLSRE